MTQKEFNKILKLHKKWLKGDSTGKCANFDYVDLRGIDLKGADLRFVNFRHADLRDVELNGANLGDTNLEGANLSGADLRSVNLLGAELGDTDFQGANLDFVALPLDEGSFEAHFDDKQLRQIAYHLIRAGLHSKNSSEETKQELSKLIDFANKSHRVDDFGCL